VRDPVHAGDKALTWETPTKRGRVNRYATVHFRLLICLTPLQVNWVMEIN
jgi:hypothetical protein